jgi:predicted transcriptional regulator
MEFFYNLISGAVGGSLGGCICWLAVQKVIDDRIENKQKTIWDVVDKIKKEYQPKSTCKIIHEFADKENRRIEETLRRIEEKIDKMKGD